MAFKLAYKRGEVMNTHDRIRWEKLTKLDNCGYGPFTRKELAEILGYKATTDPRSTFLFHTGILDKVKNTWPVLWRINCLRLNQEKARLVRASV